MGSNLGSNFPPSVSVPGRQSDRPTLLRSHSALPTSPLPQSLLALAAALALLAATVFVTLALRRWWKARLLARRMATAASAEAHAEQWLRVHGYQVLARQLSGQGTLTVDGQPYPFDIRADLLVQMGDERVIVEVKSGDAADPFLPSTRRQLREYAAVFDVSALYLFDATRGQLHRIEFPADGS